MKVFMGSQEIEAPVVGFYGTEQYPVVSVDGKEHVAEEYFVDAQGSLVSGVCQSRGCDYCEGHHSGCRCGENAGLETVYVI